jgi:hypothetical protein
LCKSSKNEKSNLMSSVIFFIRIGFTKLLGRVYMCEGIQFKLQNLSLLGSKFILGFVIISGELLSFAFVNSIGLVYSQKKVEYHQDSQKPITSIKDQEIIRNLQSKANCPLSKKAVHKIALRLHITMDPNRKFNEEVSWLRDQIKTANRLFKKVKVCFIPKQIVRLSARHMRVKTRRHRTALGRHQNGFKPRVIDLFIVSLLGDVDKKGEEIRGVHWRDPKDRQNKRWIFLSRIARPQVLAHELGHYFSLPHSTYPASIMNKNPRKNPPYEQRGFVKNEIKQMIKARKEMLKSKHLSAL